ncbi:MAG: TauD/TfdA family dioxygenase [Gammaproteobacteria bacterium]|nr:TauD/TfdA family dioxygenase [Gammaproteobacteria bacterium]
MAGALGAEIEGVDLGEALDDTVFAEIHRAWLAHHVIVFRDQDISPDQHLRFARRFGDIHIHPFNAPLDGYPEILQILKTEEMRLNNGSRWHSDQMYTARPAKATTLVARELPPYGGDTLFANLHLAYEALSPAFAHMLEGLRGVNNGDSRKYYGLSRAERVAAGIATMPQKASTAGVQTLSVHPLVRSHPETGRKALYFGSHTERLDGMSMEESAPLLAWLTEFASRPEFTARLRWRVGTVTLWDNRCTQHLAVNDYHGFRRCMHKITIQGDTPYLARVA